jgi:hypothetical protein
MEMTQFLMPMLMVAIIDLTEIDTLKVKIGTFFKYKIMDIETGSCSPHLEQLVMEKFEK